MYSIMGRPFKPWTLLIISITSFGATVTDNTHVKNGYKTSIVDGTFIQNATVPTSVITIKTTFQEFLNIEDDLKQLIQEDADTYCHKKRILSPILYVSLDSISLADCAICPKGWLDLKECVQCNLSIQLQATQYVEKSDLINIVYEVQNSTKYKQHCLKQTQNQSSSKTLIIILSAIIIILLFIITSLLYVFRNEIRIFCNSLRNKKTKTADVMQFSNGIFTDEELVESNEKIVTSTGNTYDNTTNFPNKIYYIESNSSASGCTTSTTVTLSEHTATTEIIDDFDSDTEIEINFPSPLNAPPLPPRSSETVSVPNKKQMHYMVSPIY